MTNNSARQAAIDGLERGKDRLFDALPAGVIDKGRFWEIALNLVRTQIDMSKCNPETIPMAIYGIARLGLMPDPVLGQVYVVPYKGRATVVPGYRGLITLARRSGMIRMVHTELAREGDKFEYWVDENGPHLNHHPMLDGNEEGRAVTYGYCIAEIVNDSHPQIDKMSIAEIDKRATGSPIWKDWPDEQRRKTCVKHASKYWPLSTEFAEAVRLDDQATRGETQALSPQLEHEAHPPADSQESDPLLEEASDDEKSLDEQTLV